MCFLFLGALSANEGFRLHPDATPEWCSQRLHLARLQFAFCGTRMVISDRRCRHHSWLCVAGGDAAVPTASRLLVDCAPGSDPPDICCSCFDLPNQPMGPYSRKLWCCYALTLLVPSKASLLIPLVPRKSRLDRPLPLCCPFSPLR